ncbi:MAG: MFS transporter [candidate division NC10 bacterium]|nr:MFS transporter [candidate division NC10 bacterium]
MTGKGTSQIFTRDFLVAALANFLFFTNLNAYNLLPLYIKELGGGEAQIGLIMGTYSATAIFLQPLAGSYLDRLGRRRFMHLGAGAIFLASMAFAFLPTIGPFVFLRFLQGLGYSAFFVANFTVVADMVPFHRRAEAVGIFGISGLVTIAASPALGELVIEAFGYKPFFLGLAGVALICLGVTRRVSEPHFASLPSSGPSLSWLLGHREFAVPLSAGFIFGLAMGTVFAFLPTYAREVGIGRIGPFYIAYTLAAIGVRVLLGRLSDVFGRRQVIQPSLVALALGTLLLAGLRSFKGLWFIGVLNGGAHGFLYPTLSALLIDRSEGSSRGKVLGAFSAAVLMGSASGAMAFGLVAEILGYPVAYAISAGMIFLGFMIFSLLDQELGP